MRLPSLWIRLRLRRDTKGAQSIVDYGCGNGRHLARLLHIPERTGIDMIRQEPFLDADCVFLEGDMRELVGDHGEVALFIDSIEHLTKEDGLALIEKAKEFHQKIIVFTPKGFWDNHKGEDVHPDNPYQKHLSGWEPKDLPGFVIETTKIIGPAPISMYGVWAK